jgi:hypothetical protein
VVTILAFMVRYASVVADDLHRMQVARESRGSSGSRLGHVRAVAAGAGTLFVRTYGRGERAVRAGAWRSRRCSRCDRRSCARRASSNLDPASRRELADVLTGLDVTLMMVTHDLPYALQLCERSVLMDGGRIVADRATRDMLADTELMAAHRFELPYGFDPLSVPGAAVRAQR